MNTGYTQRKQKRYYVLITHDYKGLSLKVERCLINKFLYREDEQRLYTMRKLKVEKLIL